MIHEYAIDPELAVLLSQKENRAAYRLVLDGLRPEAGRLPSWVPKMWQRVVVQAADRLEPLARERALELVRVLGRFHVERRTAEWDGHSDWSDVALMEHSRRPFRGILVGDDEGRGVPLMSLGQILEGTAGPWRTTPGQQVPRTASEMAQVVGTLLAHAKEIDFVDPYFRPSRHTYRATVERFMNAIEARAVVGGDAPSWVRFHLKGDARREQDSAAPFFRDDCEKHLARLIPQGLTLEVLRWREKPGREALHNRYVLTELGGLQFGHGLDEGQPGASDVVSLLGEDSLSSLRRSFRPDTEEFELDATVSVWGKRRAAVRTA